jgi:hypothetical protein
VRGLVSSFYRRRVLQLVSHARGVGDPGSADMGDRGRRGMRVGVWWRARGRAARAGRATPGDFGCVRPRDTEFGRDPDVEAVGRHVAREAWAQVSGVAHEFTL